MKTIDPIIFPIAKKYLQQNCRPLEIARFEYLFENGSSEKYFNELIKFQNFDGGFGHGLEPDSTHPESSPLATTLAFQYLSEIKNSDGNIINKAIKYFENTYDASRHGWFAMDEKVNGFPHAIWWNWDPVKKMTPIDENWGNPSAEIVGYLYKYQQYLTKLDINELMDFTVDYWVNKTEFSSEHETYCYIQLYKNVDENHKKLLEPNLIKATKLQVKTDVESWKKYTPQPLHFASTPDFFLYDTLNEYIDNNLDFLIDTMTADGIWFPHWNWCQYETEWGKAKIIWAGIITIRNLKILQEYNRV